jgi:large conductance mechanosensitive channel
MLPKLDLGDPGKKALTLVDEFKAFALKGNVIDLAVGVVVGAAFARIVDSLVKNVLMPVVGLLLPGDKGYTGWTIGPVRIGLFLDDVVSFLIIALALFLFIVKFLGWIMRAKKEEAAAAPPLTRDQELLTEIRDLLRAKS